MVLTFAALVQLIFLRIIYYHYLLQENPDLVDSHLVPLMKFALLYLVQSPCLNSDMVIFITRVFKNPLTNARAVKMVCSSVRDRVSRSIYVVNI